MTFADLFTALVSRGVLPNAKDKKTALRYLSSALGYKGLEACPVDAACLEEATWGKALEAHWATLTAQGRTISTKTRGETRTNIRKVFREAETSGLLHAPVHPVLIAKSPRRLFERQQQETSPFKRTYDSQTGPRRYGLPQAQWPPDIAQGWREYQIRSPLDRREATSRAQANRMEVYLGYLAHICGDTPTWAGLFDVGQLRDFVRWHGTRLGSRITSHGRSVAILIAHVAKVQEHPLSEKLADLSNSIKPPAPVHNKQLYHFSLAEIEDVANACLADASIPLVPRRAHPRPQHRGARRASRFQVGLMLKILVRIPLRQRNLREMRLGRNLYKDPEGHWQLHFAGDELKIGMRGTQVNVYSRDLTTYCPPDTDDLLPTLEKFIAVHRPCIPGTTPNGPLFMTRRGNPFEVHGLYGEIASAVAMRTGQRFYPYLIRTIWATEYLEKYPGDFAGAAEALGDTLAVVMKSYYTPDKKALQVKNAAFVATALKGA